MSAVTGMNANSRAPARLFAHAIGDSEAPAGARSPCDANSVSARLLVLEKRDRQSDAEHGRRQADSDHRVTPISECAVHGPTSIEQFESITFLASWHLEIPALEGLCSGGLTDPETEPVMHYDRVEFQSEAYSRNAPCKPAQVAL